MKTEHPTNLLPSLLLGMLDPEEARVVHAHLATCEPCRQELEVIRQQILGLSADSSELTPRAHVKHNLMARVNQAIGTPHRRPTAFQRLGITAALSTLVTLFMLATYFLYAINQRDTTVTPLINPTPITAVAAPTPDLFDLFASTAGTDAHSIPVMAAAPAAKATLYTHQGDPRIGFVADSLPPAPHGHTYQLWVATGATQVSLGTFDPHDGHVKHLGTAPQPIDSYTGAMVTIEPTGGSETPSTMVLWQLEL
jgi:anti-sigma-K factor RskA